MDKECFTVATFNVNSLRARLHIVIPWLEQNRVDVLCMQETKVQDPDFPEDAFRNIGYNVVYRGQKSYNGVAIASVGNIEEVAFGFDDSENTPEDEARLIRCRVDGIHIVNTYVPQGKEIGHPYFEKKLKWFDRLKQLFDRHYSPSDNLLWSGDLNVAPEPEDVYAPERHENHVCFHKDVRDAFDRVKSWGFVDIFRLFNKGPDHYTFFDYRIRGSVKRGLGWRIDHILATRPLAEKAKDSRIDLEPRLMEKPSDHTFLIASFSR